MPDPAIRRILTFLTLSIIYGTVSLAQSTTTFKVPVNTYTSD